MPFPSQKQKIKDTRLMPEDMICQSITPYGVVRIHDKAQDKKYPNFTQRAHRNGKPVTYIKGASEKIIEKCTHYLGKNGSQQVLSAPPLLAYLDEQALRSMRLLAVAKVDGTDETQLTLICVLSIRDNVRKEVVDAIREVQNADIQVVIVTGDRKETAVAILLFLLLVQLLILSTKKAPFAQRFSSRLFARPTRFCFRHTPVPTRYHSKILHRRTAHI